MSVHKQPNGKWRTVWRGPDGRRRSQTFDLKGDADTYDREIKRAKQLGPHLMAQLTQSHETLDDFIRGPWAIRAAKLAPKTKAKYRWMLTNHMGSLGDEPLVTLNVACLERHQQQLLDNGVAPNTVREIFAMLAAILQVAARYGQTPGNPVRSVDKVAREPREPVAPLTPVELETLIAAAAGRDRAILVLGGYLGLRPLEIRQVPWTRLQGARFTVEKVDTKPSASPRVIDVPAAALVALKEWRLADGRLPDQMPIIGLSARNMNAWNTRLRNLARDTIGRDDLTAYTLRHSHASALHYAGYTAPRAAQRMGHTTIVHLNHYAHVVDGLDDRRWPDLDALIVAARTSHATLESHESPMNQRGS